MKKSLMTITLVFFTALMAHADVFIKQNSVTPSGSEVLEQWLGEDKMAVIGKETSIIIDMNAGKLAIINHLEKTYMEMSIPVDMTSLMPPEAAPMMEQMMKGMTVTVEKTGAARKVAGIDTVSYKMTMDMMGKQMPMTLWVAKDLPFDWKKHQEIYSQMMLITMQGGEKMIKEFSKIQGYPLATEMDMMGMKTTTETIEIRDKATPPDSVYTVPSGYQKTEFMDME